MTRYPGWDKWMPPHLQPKRRKFNNTPTEIDGVTFASKREADRYLVLKDMVKAGEIRSLQLQPRFPLHVVRPDGVTVEIGSWIGDFLFTRRDGTVEVNDAKGVRTDLFKWKKKHAEAEHGITIIEV